MKRLHLLRHAKSSWKDAPLEDHERPLAGRGRRASDTMAGHLKQAGIAPDLVLCSSSVRTRETLARLDLDSGAPVEVERELYEARPQDLLARLRRIPDEVGSVMLIGHNPSLQQLALSLARGGDRLDDLTAKFPTAALATLEFEGTWSELEPGWARLSGYVKPKELE